MIFGEHSHSHKDGCIPEYDTVLHNYVKTLIDIKLMNNMNRTNKTPKLSYNTVTL